MAVLYQVEQQGRQTAFVGEDGAGLVGLYPLLARAAAITENENNSSSRRLFLSLPLNAALHSGGYLQMKRRP